jgi:hypothetical protein
MTGSSWSNDLPFGLPAPYAVRKKQTGAHPQMANLPDIGVARKI